MDEVTVSAAKIGAPAEVHSPDAYSRFLIRSVQLSPTDVTACDLTTGSGYHAVCLASAGLRVVAVDRSSSAVAAARENLRNNDVTPVDVRLGDLYQPLAVSEKFDVLVAWPPVMPTPAGTGLDRPLWWQLANDGGPYGRDVFDQVIRGAPSHLTPRGSLWLLHPWYFSMQTTQRVAADAQLVVTELAASTFPLGVVSTVRLPYIRSLGFEPAYESGEPKQTMTVLRLNHFHGDTSILRAGPNGHI